MPDSTLVSVEIETGRTHQIRVHLSEAGYPIIGDRLYDGREKHTSRLLLHASYLSFVCPRTGEAVEFESTAPDEFYTDPVVPV